MGIRMCKMTPTYLLLVLPRWIPQCFVPSRKGGLFIHHLGSPNLSMDNESHELFFRVVSASDAMLGDVANGHGRLGFGDTVALCWCLTSLGFALSGLPSQPGEWLVTLCVDLTRIMGCPNNIIVVSTSTVVDEHFDTFCTSCCYGVCLYFFSVMSLFWHWAWDFFFERVMQVLFQRFYSWIGGKCPWADSGMCLGVCGA